MFEGEDVALDNTKEGGAEKKTITPKAVRESLSMFLLFT
jgi:hypothetical protein